MEYGNPVIGEAVTVRAVAARVSPRVAARRLAVRSAAASGPPRTRRPPSGTTHASHLSALLRTAHDCLRTTAALTSLPTFFIFGGHFPKSIFTYSVNFTYLYFCTVSEAFQCYS